LSSKDEAITSLMKTAFANIFNDVATLLEKLPSPSAYLFTEGGACEKCICRAMTASVKCRCIYALLMPLFASSTRLGSFAIGAANPQDLPTVVH